MRGRANRTATATTIVAVRTPPAELPGSELVNEGVADLHAGRVSEASLLVLIAAPRLRALDIEIPNEPEDPGPESPEHRLYSLLSDRQGTAAHSRYNALLARIASFARAAEADRASSR